MTRRSALMMMVSPLFLVALSGPGNATVLPPEYPEGFFTTGDSLVDQFGGSYILIEDPNRRNWIIINLNDLRVEFSPENGTTAEDLINRINGLGNLLISPR